MRQEDIWNAEAAARYDTPGEGMFAPDMLDPAVDRLYTLIPIESPAVRTGIAHVPVGLPPV